MALRAKQQTEKAPALPLPEQVVEARVMPVYGRGVMNRHVLFGVGVVLTDSNERQTRAYNVGTRIPENLDQAVTSVLGFIGPQMRAFRKVKVLPYALTAAHDIVPEHELLDMLSLTEPLVRTAQIQDDIESPLRLKGMLRESESFTPFYRPEAPAFGRIALGEYDVD